MDRSIYFYMPTHARAIPWLIGIALGYLLYQTKNDTRLHISENWENAIWLIAIIVMSLIIFGPYEMHKAFHQVNKLEDATYLALSNLGWSLAIGWIILYSCKYPNGIINKFLSHGLWLPVARLSFSIYMVHLYLQYMLIASTKTNLHFSDVEMLHSFTGDVGFAFVIALVWYLMYEIPFCHLAKYWLMTNKPIAIESENNTSDTSVTVP